MDGTFKRNGIDAKNNSDIIIKTSDEVKEKFAFIQPIQPIQPIQIEPLENVEAEPVQGTSGWAENVWNSIKGNATKIAGKIWNTAGSFLGSIQKLFSKPEVTVVPEEMVMPELMVLPELSDSTGSLVTMPNEDSYSFWNQTMTEKTKEKYDKKNHGGVTQCNIFFSDIVKEHLGSDVYDSIFSGGLKKSNELFEDFKTNPNLERITIIDVRKIQEMADSGTLVFMVYKNPNPKESGHIAFVGNSGLTLSATEPMPDFDGKKGSSLDPDLYWPVLAHAGVYVGITPMIYGTSGWNREGEYEGYKSRRDFLLENNLYFYTVKGGK
jgi:hypothetical protein